MGDGRAEYTYLRPAMRRALFYSVAGLAVLLLLWYLRDALLPVLLGLALAYLLAPLVRSLERREVPTAPAIVLTYVGVGVAVFAVGLFIIPPAGEQLEKLARLLPEYSEMAADYLERVQAGMYRVRLPLALQVALLDGVGRVEGLVEESAQRFVDVCFTLMSRGLALMAAPVLAFYFLLDRRRIIGMGIDSLPAGWRDPTLQLLRRLDAVLVGFVRSRIIISAFVGLVTAASFALLGLPLSLLIGMTVGIADLIPYFGPVLGAVPALAVAAIHSPPAAVKVLIILAVVQQVESAVISPLVLGDGVHLHPIWVVIALFVGAQVAGLLGMLLGVPLLACLRVVGEFALTHWRSTGRDMI